MTNESARIILLQMLDGLDPTTGELLPPDHLLNDATVIRALHTAVLALTDISHPVRAPVNRNGRLNAGRAWTEMDRDALAVLSRVGRVHGDDVRKAAQAAARRGEAAS